jgi:hypothetical protein
LPPEGAAAFAFVAAALVARAANDPAGTLPPFAWAVEDWIRDAAAWFMDVFGITRKGEKLVEIFAMAARGGAIRRCAAAALYVHNVTVSHVGNVVVWKRSIPMRK